MRFDDTLATVLAVEPSTPAAAGAAWRQIVDLIGRGRAPADDRAMAALASIAGKVPVAVRAASARALFGAQPPPALVRMLALDDIAVGAPVLRSADLQSDAWIALLPALSPTARAVLRHRRDLPDAVVRALASFGAVDFVLGAEAAAQIDVIAPEPVALPATPMSDPGPFVSVGSVALGLPLVAEALRRENDNEAPPAQDGAFRIADVVARLEAFQRRRDAAPSAPEPAQAVSTEGFRFETDAAGVIRQVDGAPRAAIVGFTLARPARPAEPGVDGIAAGAFRRRARFVDARLAVAGVGSAAGIWLIAGVPAFDAASGRFTGYRGVGRRASRHEHAAVTPASDSLRQLVHELRTPAGAIAGFSEMIEHQMLGPVAEPYREQAAVMRGDAGGLLAAIEDLDAAARIDAGALQLRTETIPLAPLLARVAADLTPLAGLRGARLIMPDTAADVVADPRVLERLLVRVVGAMLGAATNGETIGICALDGGGTRIGLAILRPTALDVHPGEAVLGIDDEDSPASLLGIGFALRHARNLARELGGSLAIGQRSLTLYLPAAVNHAMERARIS